MDDPHRRRTERKSGSSSRSPSLSRRTSLKDKKGTGTIAKVKGKKSGATGSKKERWLLTRKTWRYMSDAVGNLLPESHRSTTSGAVGGSSSGVGRRASGSTTAAEVIAGPSSAAAYSVVGSSGFHSQIADIPISVKGSATRPTSMFAGIIPSGSGGGGIQAGSGSKGAGSSSTVASPTYGGIMSFPSHRPGVTPTGPGPGKGSFQMQQQSHQSFLVATDKFFPPNDDIATLEKHFEAVCSKEKKFLLWTRTKSKGLSGPALREHKLKQNKEKASKQAHPSGHRDSADSIFDIFHTKQMGFGTAAVSSPGTSNKENIIASGGGYYYSPTTEDEDNEGDLDEITVRERRKSSTASSVTSVRVAGQQGLHFFHPLSTLSSHGSESSYSMILSPQGTKICRNTGTQTDPFPEELLIRFRLQAVEEERQQRQVTPTDQSDVESPISPGRTLDGMAPKLFSPPTTTTSTASPLSPTSSDRGLGGRTFSGGSGRESQEKVIIMDTLTSSTRPSISGQSESMATTKSGETGGTAISTTTVATDKKSSEESGYSSSISDTVMRYLRMVRKNSKADNKDTIDRFKTVNYDRSLRNIKSKNVTVEEALEHEKNKEQAAQQLKQQQQQQQNAPTQVALKTETSFEVKSGDTNASSSTTPVKTKDDTNTGTGKIMADPLSPGSLLQGVVKVPSEKTDEIILCAEPAGPLVQTLEYPGSPTTSTPTLGSPRRTSVTPSGTGERKESSSITADAAIISNIQRFREGEKEQFLQGSNVILDDDIPPSSSPPPPPISPTESELQSGDRSAGSPRIGQEAVGQPSVGIQAGESLVRFLRNLNLNPLARKMSDFSSSCCSSESPAEVFSPRYSFATTGLSGSASDTEMCAQHAGIMDVGEMRQIPRQQQSRPIGFAVPSAREESSIGRSSSQYDEFLQESVRGFRKGSGTTPLSSSWTGGNTIPTGQASSSAASAAIKKSFSVQQILGLGGELASTVLPVGTPAATTTATSNYSLSQLFHYSPSKSSRSRDRQSGTAATTTSQSTISTPATPTTSSMSGSSGGLMKSFFSSSPFSSTFGLKRSTLRKPTSTTSLTITTNTGSDSLSGSGGSGGLPPPTTISSPNLLSLIQSSAASAGSGFSSFFTSSSRGNTTATGGGATSDFTRTSLTSASAEASGELRAQEVPSCHPPLYSRSSLPFSKAGLTEVDRNLNPHHHHQHHHHHHLVSTSTSIGSSTFTAKGLSDFLFPTSTAKRSSTRSNVDLHLSPYSGVMQKSKSSSSVLPLYGSSGNVSGGGPGVGSTATYLRVSPSGSVGGEALSVPGDSANTGGAGVPVTSNNGGSGGSRLISKSKLFKTRSKSSTRATTSSSGSAICSWSPQGRCKWKSVTGKVVILEQSQLLSLSEVERATLQEIALDKLRALNLGADVKIPKEKLGGGQQKPKRRPYLLKKKALSTGFFESGSKGQDVKESTGGGSGLVFGISLSQCVANDRLQQMKAEGHLASSSDSKSDQLHHKRSQNGSRNSVSSVCEMAKDEKDPLKPSSTPQLSSSSVPALVTACIAHLEKYGLHTTGIFRVSTSLKRIRQLREDIDSGKDIDFGEDHSPHDVAALLKEFLRDLPEPLLSRDLYQAFLKTQKIRNRKLQLEAIQHLVQLLPLSSRDTLAALLTFFAKVVANASETRSKTGEILPGNKMEGYSLATLIAPNILPCMPTEGAAIAASTSTMDQNAVLTKERRESIDLVNYMISNYSALFDVTPELLHDVYLHLMDTNPEAIEGILKQKCGPQDDGMDELDTTSSVFEESEGGELVEPEEVFSGAASSSAGGTGKVYRRREEILHEGAGKGGSEETRRCRGKRGDDLGTTSSIPTDPQPQSGGESDSSVGGRSTSRWFRRSRGDTKGRTSSDSGNEKVRGNSRKRENSLFEAKRANSLDSVNIQEPAVVPAATRQSVRSMPSSSSPSNQPPGTTTTSGASGATGGNHMSRPLSGSDQSLRVPEHLLNTRRQSSPVLESSGIITASLKIPVPVPLNIDDTDIPFIEDENNFEIGGGPTPSPVSPYRHHLTLHQQQQSQQQQHHHQQVPLQQPPPPPPPHSQQRQSPSSYQYLPHHHQFYMQDFSVSSTDPVNTTVMSRRRSMSTDSSIPLKTTSSSATTTPISSPPRQPSSEVSSPTEFSPPTSPPLGGTFPMEEMTARMLIGSGVSPSSVPTAVTALSSTPSLHHQFQHGSMTSPSGVGYQSSSTATSVQESKSPVSTIKSKVEKSTNQGVSPPISSSSSSAATRITVATTPSQCDPRTNTSTTQPATLSTALSVVGSEQRRSLQSSSPQSSLLMSTIPAAPSQSFTRQQQSPTKQKQKGAPTPSSSVMITGGDPKGLGRETKGANIGGLIKSKTADFDKLSTTIPICDSPEQLGIASSTSNNSGSVASSTLTTVTVAPSTATAPVPVQTSSSHHHLQHQNYSIAPKMRLRSQENVFLKQQFLLRQQQQQQQGESSTSRRERTSQKNESDEVTTTPSSPAASQRQNPEGSASYSSSSSGGSRALSRRKIVGSASSSAIMTTTPSSGGVTTVTTPRPKKQSSGESSVDDDSWFSHHHHIITPPTPTELSSIATTSGSATITTATVSTGGSPSRWKRSEIIASRQPSHSSSDPETFV